MTMVEDWLNSVVADFQIDDKNKDVFDLMKGQGVSRPLAKIKCDRKSLIDEGLQHEEVDALYRTIFVHSCAFFETLNENTTSLKGSNKYCCVQKLWKLFMLVLEYANPSTYESMLLA